MNANYAPLKVNSERLQGVTDADGGGIEVVALPMPSPIYFDGARLPASYASFYIANHNVIGRSLMIRKTAWRSGVWRSYFRTGAS